MARVKFTAGRLAAFSCPAGTTGNQAFLWDSEVAGLAFRATAAGSRAFIFQSRHEGKALRVTIGDPAEWSIPDARAEARRLQRLLDSGIDPRLERTERIAQQAARRQAERIERARKKVLGLDAWAAYVEDRRPHWGTLNHADHLRFAGEGGAARRRWKGKLTQPGVLHQLLGRPLGEIDADAVARWLEAETKARPTSAALAYRMLRAFINWCAEHRDYKDIVHADACKAKRTREKLAKPAARADALQREQLRAWFDAVRKDPNPVVAAYLQALLLTGARREELARLRWEHVDFVWKSLRIRDKVEGERVIPLTPYVAALLRDLKARNETPPKLPRRLRADPEAAERAMREWKASPWVFESAYAKAGRLKDPRSAHVRALQAAGLPHVSIHGLRRSFGTLAEWCEVPVGIVAQIQGHKPSAIAEKHYRVRPLDLLRLWHERIEAWILDEAGIAPGARPESLQLRAVA